MIEWKLQCVCLLTLLLDSRVPAIRLILVITHLTDIFYNFQPVLPRLRHTLDTRLSLWQNTCMLMPYFTPPLNLQGGVNFHSHAQGVGSARQQQNWFGVKPARGLDILWWRLTPSDRFGSGEHCWGVNRQFTTKHDQSRAIGRYLSQGVTLCQRADREEHTVAPLWQLGQYTKTSLGSLVKGRGLKLLGFTEQSRNRICRPTHRIKFIIIPNIFNLLYIYYKQHITYDNLFCLTLYLWLP